MEAEVTSPFLNTHLNATNFRLSTALAAFHKFWLTVVSSSLIFSFAVFNLLLILSSVLFTSKFDLGICGHTYLHTHTRIYLPCHS